MNQGEALHMIASVSQIESRMFLIREQKVMLSQHLAELYEVEPRALNQAVKRNIERFPEDFMFQLNPEEFANLKSQFVTSSWGGIRTAPWLEVTLPTLKGPLTSDGPRLFYVAPPLISRPYFSAY